MSNAIANSFALLNEIRQELNQTKTTNLRNISKSPSPKKTPLSTLTAPLRPNTNNMNNVQPVEIPRSASMHKTNKYPVKPPPYEKNNESAIDRYYSENYEENSLTRKKKAENFEKIENFEKNVETPSSEMIQKLKDKIDDEIKSFANSCDEISSKINDLIKNIDATASDSKDQRIDEESEDESDGESNNKRRKNDSKQKFNNYDEKNLFKSLNESFNKIVQNLDTKKMDYLNKKLNS